MPETSCRWCGLHLTPSNRPGRPRVTHPGECARRYRNRADLSRRVEAYYEASQPDIDRSTVAPTHVRQTVGGESAEALSDGFSPLRRPRYRGKQLIAAVEAYEAAQRLRRRRLAGQEETNEERADELRRLVQSQFWEEPLPPSE